MKPALFLDRDGIFNYVIPRNQAFSSPRNWDEVKEYEGLKEGLHTAKSLGYATVLISNQPCISRGLVAEDFVIEYQRHLVEKYQLDGAYYCSSADPSHPDKKPNPGMFQKAAKDLGLDLKKSFHVGDTDRDTIAAKNVGCRSIVWDRSYNQHLKGNFRVRSMEEVIEILRKH